jgi:hypothetical protein
MAFYSPTMGPTLYASLVATSTILSILLVGLGEKWFQLITHS